MMWIMINGFAKKMPASVKEYVRENWGAPFILCFIFLLIAAAVSLSMDLVAVVRDMSLFQRDCLSWPCPPISSAG